MVAVSSAVNNVRSTNATTGNAAILDCSENNSDLNLARRGTGGITVDGTPIYGLVILDDPELVVNDLTPATTATAVNVATLNTAGATKAILHAIVDNNVAGTVVHFGSATFIGGANDQRRKIETQAAGIEAHSEFTVNLDSNNDFWYLSSDGSITTKFKVYLVGYYV